MSVKEFFGKIGGLYLWGNLLAMLLVVVLLSAGVWYGLDIYTHHGEGIVVPDIKNKSFQVAYRQLQDMGLVLQVSDSGYNKKLAADCILAQSPGYGTKVKGTRYLQLTEGYITKMYLDKDDQVCGYEFVHMGKFMDAIKKGVPADEALKSVTGTYGRTKTEDGAVKSIDPRKE